MDNQDKKTLNNVSYKVIENSAIFSNPHSFFVFKKVEKIAIALYLITSYFSDKEPLKWGIRKTSTSLMNSVISITKRSTEAKTKHLRDLNRALIQISSYLEISEKIGIVSFMNYSILNDEVRNISSQVEKAVKRQQNLEEEVISDGVFKGVHTSKGHDDKGQDVLYNDNKRQEEDSPIDNPVMKDMVIPSKFSTPSLSSKARVDNILRIIKDMVSVSIKDISLKIEGISEKTIQRDLTKLIKEGVIKKEGERRWSKYSLV